MTDSLRQNIGEPEPQLGPIGPAQIIGGPCPKNQAHLNGHCRDIPDTGLTKCGVVNMKFNNYMMYENDDSLDSETTDSGNLDRRRRRRSVRGHV